MHRKFGWMMVALFWAMPAQAEVEVKTTRIAHGVEAWYAVNETVPVVDLLLSFEGAGTASDAEGKSGRAAFAAAMLTEGAGLLDSAAFQRALDENAITIEADAQEDRLRIHVHCLREHAARAGELLTMMLSAPQLNEADIARVKTQFTSLLSQLEESPNYQAQQLLAQHAFKGHPYANMPYGTKASIAALTAQDVRDYLSTYVTRGNVLIAAAGDVDSGVLDDLLEKTVEALPQNDSGAVAITKTQVQEAGQTVRQTMPLPQSVIVFAGNGVERDDQRFYAMYLLNHILGGNTLISRLGDVRQKRGLAYSTDSQLDIRRGTPLISGILATRNSTVDAALAEVKRVLSELRDKGVTTEECTDAKSYVLGAYPLQLDSSNAVANTLLMQRINHLGPDYIKEREKYFSKVTCSDINAVAEQLLTPERFLFAVVGGASDAANTPAVPKGEAK